MYISYSVFSCTVILCDFYISFASMLTQACADAEERYTRLLGERPTPTGAAGDSGEGDQMEEIPISTPDGNSNEQSPMEAGKQMTGLRSMVAI